MFFGIKYSFDIYNATGFLIDANYMYLKNPPNVNHPLVSGEWPYYLITFEFAARMLVYLHMLYLKLSFYEQKVTYSVIVYYENRFFKRFRAKSFNYSLHS